MDNLFSQWEGSQSYQVIVRYKLYHIAFWVVYNSFWALLFSGAAFLSWETLFSIITQSIAYGAGAYLNIYYFIPRLLKRQRYVWYTLSFLGCVLLSALLITINFQGMYYLSTGEWWGVAGDWFRGTYSEFLGIMASNAFTAVVAVMIAKLAKDYLKDQKRTQALEKEKLETELKFLRSQFNPHFLFNTINSIHFLIEKNPKMATNTLSKFSDLLRYQLYECNEPQIPLKKEVHYLANFVALEKLRVNKNVSVALDVSENVNGAKIAPFILMPFVENAFKHVSKGKQQDNFLRISLAQQEKQIRFTVENSQEPAEPKARDAVYYGGIGLANVKRRLDLLYPQQYTLQISSQNETYSVELTIDLHEN
ncbi:MAG: histidine kinase [Bacteroidota bacterium]